MADGSELRVRALLDSQPWDSLTPALLHDGMRVAETAARLKRFAELLILWNQNVSNLISKNDEARIVERHLRESVEPAHWIRESRIERWIDFGSGAGLPAIPLALAGVGGAWTLVESRRPKTLFLRRILPEIGVEGVTVVQARLESLVAEGNLRGAYDGFTSRATIALGPTLMLAAELIAPGGVAFLWKGSRREEEMRRDPRWTDFWELDGLMGVSDGRTVVARFTRKS